MTSSQTLSMLALRRLRTPSGEGSAPGGVINGEGPHHARALRKANERAWLVLELMLAGEPLVERARQESPDFAALLSEAVSALLERVAPEELRRADRDWRQSCWQQLRAARDAGLLVPGPAPGRTATNGHSAPLAGAGDRGESAERQVLDRLADECERCGWYCLRPLLEMRAWQGDPFVVALLAWFLRRALGPEHDNGEGLPLDLYEWDEPLLDLSGLCEVHGSELEDLLRETCGVAAGPLPRPAVDPMAASVRFQRGLASMQCGDYERAIPEMSAAIQHNPGMAAAYAQRGDAYRLMGGYDQALADYTAALRINADNPLVLINRGQTYRTLDRPDRAIADYDAALQIDPHSVVALNHRGSAHADLGDHEAAIADFTLAAQADPSYPFTYQNRAQAHAARGELDAAIADYGLVLRLNPMFTLAYVRRADCYCQKGQPERAIADYTEALRLDPLHLHAYVNRGSAYRDRGQSRRALADFEAALRLDGANPQLYLQRGITFRDNGYPERALADFQSALGLDPTDPDIYYHRALTYQQKGDSDRALADLDETIRLAPTSAEVFFQRGTLRVTRREANEALADLDEVIRLDPDMPLAYLCRAMAWALDDQLEEVIGDCTQALVLDERLIRAYTTRGTAFFRLGRHDETIADFNRALEINPKNAEALIDRGIVHARAGSQADALIDFTRAVKVEPSNARAFASRGNIYRSQEKHADALEDYTQAVLRDPRYGAAYSIQRALIHLAEGEYDRAIADCNLSLLIEPDNRRAREVREQALEARRREGPRARKKAAETPPVQEQEQTPQEQAPAPKRSRKAAPTQPDIGKPPTQEMPAARTQTNVPTVKNETPAEEESGLTEEVPEGEIRLQEDGASAVSRPVDQESAPTDDTDEQAAAEAEGGPAGGKTAPSPAEEDTEIDWTALEQSEEGEQASAEAPTTETPAAGQPAADQGATEAEKAEEAEQRRKEEETRKRLREEYLRKQAEEEKKKAEKDKKKKKKRGEEDPKEAAAAREQLKKRLMIAVLVLAGLYGGWSLYPTLRYYWTRWRDAAPVNVASATVDADELVKQYSSDPIGTHRRYGDRYLIVTGTVEEVTTETVAGLPPHAVMQVSPESRGPRGEWKMRCYFERPNDIKRVKPGQKIKFLGEMSDEIPSSVVSIAQCRMI